MNEDETREELTKRWAKICLFGPRDLDDYKMMWGVNRGFLQIEPTNEPLGVINFSKIDTATLELSFLPPPPKTLSLVDMCINKIKNNLELFDIDCLPQELRCLFANTAENTLDTAART